MWLVPRGWIVFGDPTIPQQHLPLGQSIFSSHSVRGQSPLRQRISTLRTPQPAPLSFGRPPATESIYIQSRRILSTLAKLPPNPSLRTVDQLRPVIQNYMNNTATAVPAEFIDKTRALKAAVVSIGTPWNYYYLYANNSMTYQQLWNGTQFQLFPLVSGKIPPPRTQGTANLTGTSGTVTIPIACCRL